MASRTAALLLLVAVLAATASAQNTGQCETLGTPLLTTCQPELEFVGKRYPVTSTNVPSDQQVQQWISEMPAGYPSANCCKAAEEFHTLKCTCTTALLDAFKKMGVTPTPAGLQGVSKITSMACKYTPATC